jgi:ABC-type dipeptide/oligopeptide/nickel transport system ATPase subunit
LTLTGQQGSSKSTLARIVRLLTDPNSSPIRSVQKDERDLIISAFNSWLLMYDNLSSVPPWLSDALCRRGRGLQSLRRRPP